MFFICAPHSAMPSSFADHVCKRCKCSVLLFIVCSFVIAILWFTACVYLFSVFKLVTVLMMIRRLFCYNKSLNNIFLTVICGILRNLDDFVEFDCWWLVFDLYLVVSVNNFTFLCVCFVDSCLSFLLWPLCRLSFALRILITILVSSNSSY